jgi:hypothetical protein
MRYAWDGKPLTVSDKVAPWPESRSLKCQSCGADAIFEMQILPSMLYNLEPFRAAGGGGGEGGLPATTEEWISFGSLAMFTCEASCWEDAGTDPALSHRYEHLAWHPDPEDGLLGKLSESGAASSEGTALPPHSVAP